MSRSISSLRLQQRVAAGVVLVACLLLVQAASAKPASSSSGSSAPNDRLPMGDDGSLFLAGNECGPDEYLATGRLPTCEPTCANPRPICPKVFWSGVDFVPCFCKEPLVRNQETKQCVPRSECPPQTSGPKVIS